MKIFRSTVGGLGLAILLHAGIQSALAAPIPDECKVGDFFIGSQAYTFNRFTVLEAIEKTAQAGGKTIEFYPGQRFSKDQPNAKWDHNASAEMIQTVKDALAKHGIHAVGYGVVGAGNAEEWRKIFEFAKTMGLYSITTESVDQLDTIEKLVKEFDIKVGIHEHRHQPNNPNYKVWDPNYVLSVVKDRDARIGACCDTGHWATSGLKPLDCIKLLNGRVISLHLKERKEIGKEMGDTIYGTGACDIAGILDELKRQHFEGFISLEYENNWMNSVPDVAQCIGFVRGYCAKSH